MSTRGLNVSETLTSACGSQTGSEGASRRGPEPSCTEQPCWTDGVALTSGLLWVTALWNPGGRATVLTLRCPGDPWLFPSLTVATRPGLCGGAGSRSGEWTAASPSLFCHTAQLIDRPVLFS